MIIGPDILFNATQLANINNRSSLGLDIYRFFLAGEILTRQLKPEHIAEVSSDYKFVKTKLGNYVSSSMLPRDTMNLLRKKYVLESCRIETEKNILQSQLWFYAVTKPYSFYTSMLDVTGNLPIIHISKIKYRPGYQDSKEKVLGGSIVRLDTQGYFSNYTYNSAFHVVDDFTVESFKPYFPRINKIKLNGEFYTNNVFTYPLGPLQNGQI